MNMASSDSWIGKPQHGRPKRAELPDVNINTGVQSIKMRKNKTTTTAHLPILHTHCISRHFKNNFTDISLRYIVHYLSGVMCMQVPAIQHSSLRAMAIISCSPSILFISSWTPVQISVSCLWKRESWSMPNLRCQQSGWEVSLNLRIVTDTSSKYSCICLSNSLEETNANNSTLFFILISSGLVSVTCPRWPDISKPHLKSTGPQTMVPWLFAVAIRPPLLWFRGLLPIAQGSLLGLRRYANTACLDVVKWRVYLMSMWPTGHLLGRTSSTTCSLVLKLFRELKWQDKHYWIDHKRTGPIQLKTASEAPFV